MRVKFASTSVALSIALISLAMSGALAYDRPFWAAASQALPTALVGSARGFVNALGNLGGYFGPTIGGWLQDRTSGFGPTAVFLSGTLLPAGIAMLVLAPD